MTASTEPGAAVPPDRTMRLRFAGACSACGVSIDAGVRAVYSPSTRTVAHIRCDVDADGAQSDAPGPRGRPRPPDQTDERGVAGASARREHDRRTARDAARVEGERARMRGRFGDGLLGRLAMRLSIDDSPRRSTEVWAQGAVGEEVVAARLDALAAAGVVALHDRRIPGTRANIDHLAVTPWGVWVIDAKRYVRKRPAVVTEGGFLGIGGTQRLTIGGRRRDALVESMEGQLQRVRAVVPEGVPVRGMLCFVDADWPLVGGHCTVRGIRVAWPRRLARELLQREHPTVDVEAVRRLLAARFPPA